LTRRGKPTGRVPIRLLAPRHVPMNAEEEATAVAALVAVLVAADEMDAKRANDEETTGTGEDTTSDASAA